MTTKAKDLVICEKAVELSCTCRVDPGDPEHFMGCRHAIPHVSFKGCGSYCPKLGRCQKDIPVKEEP